MPTFDERLDSIEATLLALRSDRTSRMTRQEALSHVNSLTMSITDLSAQVDTLIARVSLAIQKINEIYKNTL